MNTVRVVILVASDIIVVISATLLDLCTQASLGRDN